MVDALSVEGVGVEASWDAVMNVSGRGDGASNGDASGMASSMQGADRRRQAIQKRQRSDLTTVTVGIGYVEVEGKGELVGRGTERTHVVRLADVVAGVRRTVKRRCGSRIDIDVCNIRSCASGQRRKPGENAGIAAN